MEFAHRGTDTSAGWQDWERTNVKIEDDGIRIDADPLPVYQTLDPVAPNGPIDGAIVDLAIGGCGSVFVLTDHGHIFRGAPDGGRIVRLDCDLLPEATAVTVDATTLYVASTGESARVRAYSRYASGRRWTTQTGIDRPVTFVRIDGAVHLLDRGGNPGEGRISRIHSDGRIAPVVTGLFEPMDVGADATGAVYILEPYRWHRSDDAEQYVVRMIPAQALAHPPVPAVDTVWIPPKAFRSESDDAITPACLTIGSAGELLIGTSREGPGEPGLFGFRPTDATFAHRGAVDAGCRAVAIDHADRITLVDGNGVLRRGTATSIIQRNRDTGNHGGLARIRLDAGTPDIEWHRIRLALDRPGSDQRVSVRYHATNDPTATAFAVDHTAVEGDLKAVTHIGPRKAWRLRRAGIETIVDLAASDPETISAIVGVEEIFLAPSTVAAWQDEAASLLAAGHEELQAVDGIGRVFADRLATAGIDTLADLINRDPEVIATILGSRLRMMSPERAAEAIADATSYLPSVSDPDDLDWKEIPPNPRNALFANATGRYLWLELTLEGTRHTTPIVHAVDVSCPRSSYLEALPTVYRQQEPHTAMLAPFLALFESVLTEIGETIHDLPQYLDPDAIPGEPDHLAWLAGLLGTEIDGSWPPAAKRALIGDAPRLYRMRGTRRGILSMINCYLDHVDIDRTAWDRIRGLETDEEITPIRLFEHADFACATQGAAVEPFNRLISCPQGFLVLVHPALDTQHLDTIGRIVRHQQPAHTSGRAVALRPITVLTGDEYGERGYHSYLGINTVLSSQTFTVDTATLGQDTGLTEREPHGALGRRAQLDDDMRLS